MNKIHMLKKLSLLLLILFITSCSKLEFPGVYKIDIAQGNLLESDQIQRLKPGMNKAQVIYLLGTPMIQDPFSSNRWDYFYSLSKAGEESNNYHLVLHFVEDKLAKINEQAPFPETLKFKTDAY